MRGFAPQPFTGSAHVGEEVVTPPKACPVCRSRELTTTGKKVTATSYWRCLTCGEIWNEERHGGGRYSPRGRY